MISTSSSQPDQPFCLEALREETLCAGGEGTVRVGNQGQQVVQQPHCVARKTSRAAVAQVRGHRAMTRQSVASAAPSADPSTTAGNNDDAAAKQALSAQLTSHRHGLTDPISINRFKSTFPAGLVPIRPRSETCSAQPGHTTEERTGLSRPKKEGDSCLFLSLSSALGMTEGTDDGCGHHHGKSPALLSLHHRRHPTANHFRKVRIQFEKNTSLLES